MMRKMLWAEQQQSPRPAVRRPGVFIRQLLACLLMWLNFIHSPFPIFLQVMKQFIVSAYFK